MEELPAAAKTLVLATTPAQASPDFRQNPDRRQVPWRSGRFPLANRIFRKTARFLPQMRHTMYRTWKRKFIISPLCDDTVYPGRLVLRAWGG
jgi:hypothetical protein